MKTAIKVLIASGMFVLGFAMFFQTSYGAIKGPCLANLNCVTDLVSDGSGCVYNNGKQDVSTCNLTDPPQCFSNTQWPCDGTKAKLPCSHDYLGCP
jgi:hypothetical protein